MHRWHGLWIITQGLCMSLSFAIVLVHTVSTSIQGCICFYRQNWIIIQLLSTNEQSSYPNGPSLSGYIISLFVVHTWQYAYECFRILHLQLHTVTIYAFFLYCLYLCYLIGPWHKMNISHGTTEGTITHKLYILQQPLKLHCFMWQLSICVANWTMKLFWFIMVTLLFSSDYCTP